MVAMARPIRIEYENAAYHVTARGNERRAIFRDDKDRTCFLQTLEEAAGRFGLFTLTQTCINCIECASACMNSCIECGGTCIRCGSIADRLCMD